MQSLQLPTSAGNIAKLFGAAVIGDPERPVTSLSPLEGAGLGHLTFFADKKYERHLSLAVGATILTRRDLVDEKLSLTFLVVEDPRKIFSEIARQFSPKLPEKGISNLASISSDARIGERTVIHPFAYVGPGVEIGNDCEIFPHVTLVANTSIGHRVKILPGTVIGSDGFGYLEVGDSRIEVPQIGRVVIEDDVRIGAKCTVDRATIGETRIGAGTKIDDQVHIGHNSRVGKNCILCGQVGLGGSAILEDNVILAGQVGVAGHCTIGRGARMGAQSGTSSDLSPGETYLMSPAVPIKEALRLLKYFRRLPKLFANRQVREGM